MIRRHSLFFFSVIMLVSCSKKTGPAEKPMSERYLDSVKIEGISAERKKDFIDKAYVNAVREKIPNSKWLSKSFDEKFALALSDSTKNPVDLVSRYLDIAESKGDTLNQGNAYYQLANYYSARQKSDSAFKYYNLSREKYESLKDSLNVAEKLVLMASIHAQYNDYYGMESATTEALKFIDRRIRNRYDSIYVSIAYNNFGLVHTNLGNHLDALAAYRKALSLMTDPISRGIAQNNMAWTMMEMGDYQKAVKMLTEIASDNAALEFHETRSKVLGNLGYSYFRLGDVRALPLLEESVAIRRENRDNYGLIAGLVHLSEFYALRDREMSSKYALEALAISRSIGSTDDRVSVLQQLRKITTGEKRQFYSDEVIRLSDSIASVRQKARNQFAKYRFDASEALTENLKLKAQSAQIRLEAANERNGKILFAVGLLGTLAIASLSLLLIKRRHKQEKVRESYKTETRIAKKVHDELANDVFRAISFAESQDLSLADKRESLLQNLDHVYSKARDISRENNSIDTGDRFRDELAGMLADYNSPDRNVIVQGLGSVKWEAVAENVKIAIFRVLQELMVNMLKHSSANVAAVKFNTEGRLLKINYSDNGVGFDMKKIRANGFQNMENRIKTNGGTFSFESEDGNGLKFEMAFS